MMSLALLSLGQVVLAEEAHQVIQILTHLVPVVLLIQKLQSCRSEYFGSYPDIRLKIWY
jgi:hypothetical protein